MISTEPIKTLCAELQKKLTFLSQSRTTGKLTVEANLSEGGIGSTNIKVHTEETWNLKLQNR